MKSEGQGKLIRRLSEILHAKDVEINHLKKAKAKATATAVETATLEIETRDKQLRAATSEIAGLNEQLEGRKNLLIILAKECEQSRADNGILQERIACMEPLLSDERALRAELHQICDGVRSRMKRQEVEAEQAVLNRLAIRGARPAINRR